MTPLKSIRAKCIDCCCGQIYEVKRCVCVECPLYPFRMGHNPNRQKIRQNDSESNTTHSSGV